MFLRSVLVLTIPSTLPVGEIDKKTLKCFVAWTGRAMRSKKALQMLRNTLEPLNSGPLNSGKRLNNRQARLD